MDKRLLQRKMDNYGDNLATLAKAIGRAPATVSAKMNSKGEFTQGEIMDIKDRYKLTAEEVDTIFFDMKVS